MIRLIIIMLILTACNVQFALHVPMPFMDDATPTPEVVTLPTLTPVAYFGTVIPSGALANVRDCRIVNDHLCPVVMKLRPGDTPLKVIDISDPEWLKVELPEIGQAWVVRYVVTFRGN